MRKKDLSSGRPTTPEGSDRDENRRNLLKAGLFFASAIGVILALKILLGY